MLDRTHLLISQLLGGQEVLLVSVQALDAVAALRLRVGVSIVPLGLRHLLDESFHSVPPRGVVLRLLAERARTVLVFKVAVQTQPAEAASAAQGDPTEKQIPADGAYQMLLQPGGLSGRCRDRGHDC